VRLRRSTRYSAGVRVSGELLRPRRHSSKRCTTTKKDGTTSTARQVDAIFPVVVLIAAV
jgi:hypothetical protein